MRKTLNRAGVKLDTISYIEMHGTGTELGGPIEIQALSRAFGNITKQSIAIGLIKGNIGYLESTAGLASVIKVLLQFKYHTCLPSINSGIENPHLSLG